MSDMEMGQNPAHPDESTPEELEQLLLYGLRSQESAPTGIIAAATSTYSRFIYTAAYTGADEDEEDQDEEVSMSSDVQGALGLYAEATQDVATAGLELALGRHFACVDYCNQAVKRPPRRSTCPGKGIAPCIITICAHWARRLAHRLRYREEMAITDAFPSRGVSRQDAT